MARASISAPEHPAAERSRRLSALKSKGTKRTPQESSDAVDLLLTMVAELRARVDKLEGRS